MTDARSKAPPSRPDLPRPALAASLLLAVAAALGLHALLVSGAATRGAAGATLGVIRLTNGSRRLPDDQAEEMRARGDQPQR